MKQRDQSFPPSNAGVQKSEQEARQQRQQNPQQGQQNPQHAKQQSADALPVKQDKTQHPPQQQQGLAGVAKGKWEQQVGAAKVTWGKLTDDELLKTEGEFQKLCGLVQERYALSVDDAKMQVRKFLGSKNTA